MTPELDAKLCEKYPKIFADRHRPMNETCMCWGLDVGDGWHDIIDVLCHQIQHHCDWLVQQQKFRIERGDVHPAEALPEDSIQVVADQVKEKFGGLRFYYHGGDAYVDGMVRMAEAWAYRTCEDCGAKGTARGGGWIRVLCDKCHEEGKKKG